MSFHCDPIDTYPAVIIDIGARRHTNANRHEIQILALYDDGKTATEIAGAVGLTRERVRQILVKHGLQSNVTAQRNAAKAAAIIESVAVGTTLTETAFALGISRPAASYFLAKSGKSVSAIRDEKFIFENAGALDAIRRGASIHSQSLNHSHENRLGRICRKLGIVSQARTRWNKSSRVSA